MRIRQSLVSGSSSGTDTDGRPCGGENGSSSQIQFLFLLLKKPLKLPVIEIYIGPHVKCLSNFDQNLNVLTNVNKNKKFVLFGPSITQL
jgi:hypothetical protein